MKIEIPISEFLDVISDAIQKKFDYSVQADVDNLTFNVMWEEEEVHFEDIIVVLKEET